MADICPVQAILQYLKVRSPSHGPLFVFQSGSPLPRSSLVSHVQAALQQANIPHKVYNGHSFRIGAATTAVQRGLEDSLIQTLGRWKSAAYKIYIRLPREQLASVSRSLVNELIFLCHLRSNVTFNLPYYIINDSRTLLILFQNRMGQAT